MRGIMMGISLARRLQPYIGAAERALLFARKKRSEGRTSGSSEQADIRSKIESDGREFPLVLGRKREEIMSFPNFMRTFHKISFKEPISKALPSIVDVKAQLDYYGLTVSLQGSGWLWENKFVMSCYENFRYMNYELSEVCVEFYDGRTLFARVHLIDHLLGIVILELEKYADAPIAKYIISDVTKIGDVVMIISSGMMHSHVARVGIICNKESQNLYLKDKYGGTVKLLLINCVMYETTLGSLLINQDGVGIGMIVRGDFPFVLAIPINMALQSITLFIIFGNQFRMGQLAFFQKYDDVEPYDENYNGLSQNLCPHDYVSPSQPRNINTSKLAWGLISFLKGLIKKLKPWN